MSREPRVELWGLIFKVCKQDINIQLKDAEAKTEFSNGGKKSGMEVKKQRKSGGRETLLSFERGQVSGVYRLMLLLGLSYHHWGPNRPYDSLYSKISSLLLIYKLIRNSFSSTYNFFSK